MASERENFSFSGPVFLTAVDWQNSYHRRSVAASLVQGVYILERDRQQFRRGPQALAPPWWDFFHFKLILELVDYADRSVFGAVYEFKFPPPPPFYGNYLAPNHPPRYVVAFRGTIIEPDTWLQDLKLDLQIFRNNLQQRTRFQIAMQVVQDMVVTAGPANIWLAGHSLGSAIALLAGKNMAKIGYYVETYLFNPPFASLSIAQMMRNPHTRAVKSFITAGIAAAVNPWHQKEYSFVSMSGWVPYLFVNPKDPFCAEYIEYFEHREYMLNIGAGPIERIATQNSLGGLLLGYSREDSEPLHLLPSAHLTINRSGDPLKPHGIHQWWNPYIYCEFKLHQFNLYI